MTLLADLEDFVTELRPHGTLTATTGELTPNGYRLEVACPCGVTFERCVPARRAIEDLAARRAADSVSDSVFRAKLNAQARGGPARDRPPGRALHRAS